MPTTTNRPSLLAATPPLSPTPSAGTVTDTGATGVTGTTAEGAETLPAASTATTVKRYVVPLVRPDTVAELSGAATVAAVLPSSASTRCSTTSASGAAVQVTTACWSSGVAVTPVGAAGGVRSVGVALAVAGSEGLPRTSTATSSTPRLPPARPPKPP